MRSGITTRVTTIVMDCGHEQDADGSESTWRRRLAKTADSAFCETCWRWVAVVSIRKAL